MSSYRLIDAEKATYAVSMLCRVLKVSRSGYYAWRERSPSKRATENAALIQRIRAIHQKSRGTYGYLRVLLNSEPQGCAVTASVLPG